jgi:hypothetical protein
MESKRTLTYSIRTTPREILDIAMSRLEDHPSAAIKGDERKGTLLTRTMEVGYAMEPGNGGTRVTLEFRKRPPVPWAFVRSFLDREARKW